MARREGEKGGMGSLLAAEGRGGGEVRTEGEERLCWCMCDWLRGGAEERGRGEGTKE